MWESTGLQRERERGKEREGGISLDIIGESYSVKDEVISKV